MDHLHAFRLYRGTSVERGGFSPPAESYGMKFWDTDEDTIYWWDGTQWVLPSPRTDDWVGLNAAGAASWQPDLVAVLHNGQTTEYADPDDAFTAAVAGDVIMVPPGDWQLTALHSITNVSVAGIGGGPEDCRLYSTIANAGTLISLNTSGTIFNVYVDWDIANSNNNHVGVDVNPGCNAYFCLVDVAIAAGTGNAYALQVESVVAIGLARQCVGVATVDSGFAAGIYGINGNVRYCDGYAYAVAGTAGGITCQSHWEDFPLFGCLGYATATGIGGGSYYGLYFGAGGAPPVYVSNCYFEGSTTDVYGTTSTAYFYAVRYESETLAAGAAISHQGGDRAGKARNETITGVWTFDEEITQAEQADPAGPGAGYARIYPKDDGGQSKYYFMDDAGSVYEIVGIVEDLTVTVKPGGGGDFLTIQAAINWFQNWLIKGACKIDCDAAAYDEAVTFSGLLIAPGATLELEGDTRVLAGISYVDGAICNQAGLANGGTFNAANVCTITTNPGLDQITVSGGTVDPDFDADGWGNGDTILVYDESAGTVVTRTINSISPGGAGNNVIEITVALAAALAGDGDAICLKPDRSIDRTAAGPCIYVDSVRGITLDGWYLESHTGADCHGVYLENGALATCENIAAYVEDHCFRSDGSIGYALDGACSAWDGSKGFYAGVQGFWRCSNSVAVECDVGYDCFNLGCLMAVSCIATGSGTRGYAATSGASNYCDSSTAVKCSVGYYAGVNGTTYASSVDANNLANTADYSPVVVPPGSAEGNHFGVLYAS